MVRLIYPQEERIIRYTDGPYISSMNTLYQTGESNLPSKREITKCMEREEESREKRQQKAWTVRAMMSNVFVAFDYPKHQIL